MIYENAARLVVLADFVGATAQALDEEKLGDLTYPLR